jgi:catechol 2,3-dioxygenase-like lactoylglutathione lyase family enzyme
MVSGLSHVTLSVSDLDRAFRFYREVLGMRPVARWYKGAYLTAGDLWFCLNLEAEFGERVPNPSYDHVAFSVDAEEFERLRGRLIDAGAGSWHENRSEGDSHYFLDPDGHKLEIHVGDLGSRVASLQAKPPRDLVVFEDTGR